MFLHNFKYAMRTTMKNKTTLIWTLLFPIALATFMYMSFGELFEEEMMDVIPVAVVVQESNPSFEEVLASLSKEGEDQVIDMTVTSKKKALEKLENEEVDAIIYVTDIVYLKVPGNSYEATVLKTIIEEYYKVRYVVTDIGKTAPEMMQNALANLRSDNQYYTKMKTSDGNQDVYTNYFYAIFAMSCLFASFVACEKIQKIQANVSPLGMRRCLSPNSKMITILAEFFAMLITQFAIELITLAYMVMLGVDFGNKYPQIILVLFFGSCIGISFGIIIGSMTRFSSGAKEGICTCISMILSVMADLCASGIKYSIEQTMPIINRLNPSALIVDSFYALNIYDTYDRYFQNIATLGIMSAVLIIISFFIIRRNKYASL
ncbi:MAG: ABC transporter permease [Lachnospiraceae bacterium]|nr:ABC transporter permease [Lachnospiraceae bacterium]